MTSEPKKRRFMVTCPIAGSVSGEVEADDAESALEALMEAHYNDESGVEVEWEWLESIATGNVCHAPCNQVEVTELDAEDDE